MRSEKYDTEADAEQIKAELNAQGYTLVEVWNVEAGNFLFFQEPGWVAPPPPEDPQVQRLTKEVENLRAADLDNKSMINDLGETLLALLEG